VVCVKVKSESTADTRLLLVVHIDAEDEGEEGDNDDEVWRELVDVKLFDADGNSKDSVQSVFSRLLPSLETSTSIGWGLTLPASSFCRSLCLLRTRLNEDGSVVEDEGIFWSKAGRTSLPRVATG